jgi:hypothetical protein
MAASVPFEKVDLFTDATFKQPVDLRQAVSATTDRRLLYVRTPKTRVNFVALKRQFEVEFSISDHPFEMWRKF